MLQVPLLLGAVAFFLILALQLYTLHKISRIDKNTWDVTSQHLHHTMENTFQQSVVLQALFTSIFGWSTACRGRAAGPAPRISCRQQCAKRRSRIL